MPCRDADDGRRRPPVPARPGGRGRLHHPLRTQAEAVSSGPKRGHTRAGARRLIISPAARGRCSGFLSGLAFLPFPPLLVVFPVVCLSGAPRAAWPVSFGRPAACSRLLCFACPRPPITGGRDVAPLPPGVLTVLPLGGYTHSVTPPPAACWRRRRRPAGTVVESWSRDEFHTFSLFAIFAATSQYNIYLV